MKHRPSHLKRLEKREERSEHEMTVQDDQWKEHYMHERTTKQIKKQKKQKLKAESKGKSRVPKNLDEKNKLEQGRTPITRERSHKPRPHK